MDQRFLGAEMRGTPSPCGACRFLKRKCVRGCVFAPYFCHEEGTAHFAAIHHIFGAGRISKLLSSLPIGDRCQAAVTISFEAQARIQDPVYGCVSQILSLQQQVFSLQAQLASFKEQAAQVLSDPCIGNRFMMAQDLTSPVEWPPALSCTPC
ncbi:hypothetical protein SAY87_014881 [Trapa incisa]|uniref:LOB domain-containing protein n=1 Tax=Trapa incisa TaxID=236973 RepID=A0AAN7GKS5_9MYRT|nr:hypothetical protein SAY87_014881 [Trapa incisa]